MRRAVLKTTTSTTTTSISSSCVGKAAASLLPQHHRNGASMMPPHQHHHIHHRSLSTTTTAPSKLSPEVKEFQEAKQAYKAELAAIRKTYIAEVQQKFAEEEAKRRAETARIKEAKRKRLLIKAEERKRNLAIFLEIQQAQRARFGKYLEAMQKVRDQYMAEVRNKQTHLLKALATESSLWVTAENLDQKITPELFEVAGRTTFSPTKRSKDWHYMALPRVPDFTAFSEEDLFDEKEDVHFLTEKSPWKGDSAAPGEEEGDMAVPEGHDFYEAGPVERLPRRVGGESGVVRVPQQGRGGKGGRHHKGEEEAMTAELAEPEDANLYFEDAAYRPSLLGKVLGGSVEDFQPQRVMDEEVEHMRELAERYEEQLLAIVENAQGEEGEEGEGMEEWEEEEDDDDDDDNDEWEDEYDDEEDGEEEEEEEQKASAAAGFDPKEFAEELVDGEGEKKKKEGGE